MSQLTSEQIVNIAENAVDTVATNIESVKGNAANMASILAVWTAMSAIKIAHDAAQAAALSIKSRYSTLEVDSWPVQQEQAETVLSSGTLPEDALLVVLAKANGVSVADFAARVMANVAAAESATKAVVSHQQALELLVNDATTVPEVMAIEVSYAS